MNYIESSYMHIVLYLNKKYIYAENDDAHIIVTQIGLYLLLFLITQKAKHTMHILLNNFICYRVYQRNKVVNEKQKLCIENNC